MQNLLGNTYQKLTFLLSSQQSLEKQLTQAIERGDIAWVRKIAPYVNLNKHFSETGELPVFFALIKDQPEIADILVYEFNASVDIKYPEYLHTTNKTSLERACELAAKKEFKEEYLLKLKNYSSDDSNSKLLAEEKIIKKGMNCFENKQKIDCNNIKKTCITSKEIGRNTDDCENIDLLYQSEEFIWYIFMSPNNSTYQFFSSYQLKEYPMIAEEGNYGVSPAISEEASGHLRGNSHSSQEDMAL